MSQTLLRLLPAAVLLLALVSACDSVEDSAPFQITSGSRTFYGYLDAESRVQRARVEARRQDVDFPRSADQALLLDTEVYSVFVDISGVGLDTVRWTQQAERLPDGTYAPVFVGRFTPSPLTRYRIGVVRRAAGARDATREETEIVVPKASDPIVEPWTTEGGRVLVNLHWPAAYNAKADTLLLRQAGCVYRPDSLLAEPDTSFLVPGDTIRISPDSLLIGPDSLISTPDTLILGAISLLVLAPPDTIRTILAEGDTVRASPTLLAAGPNTLLNYIRSLQPYPFVTYRNVDVMEDRGGFSALVDLSGVRRDIERQHVLTDSHRVRHDFMYLSLRVRDRDWDGDGGNPNEIAAGFLGGTDSVSALLYPPVAAFEAAGFLGPAETGFTCPGLSPYP